jgi:hypothetical protein
MIRRKHQIGAAIFAPIWCIRAACATLVQPLWDALFGAMRTYNRINIAFSSTGPS